MAGERARTERAIAAFASLADRLDALANQRRTMVAAARRLSGCHLRYSDAILRLAEMETTDE